MNANPETPSQEAPRPLPEPNPVTRAAHRRESFWQITVPFILALLVILLLAAGTIWAASGGSKEVMRWADVSVIWLLGPQLLFSLIGLILLSAVTFGLFKLIEILPRYTRLVQDFMLLVRLRVREIADKLVEPFLKIHSFKASMDALMDNLRGRRG